MPGNRMLVRLAAHAERAPVRLPVRRGLPLWDRLRLPSLNIGVAVLGRVRLTATRSNGTSEPSSRLRRGRSSGGALSTRQAPVISGCLSAVSLPDHQHRRRIDRSARHRHRSAASSGRPRRAGRRSVRRRGRGVRHRGPAVLSHGREEGRRTIWHDPGRATKAVHGTRASGSAMLRTLIG